jgi:pyruvate formate lyase activating enzyme
MNLRRFAATEWESADLVARLNKNKDFIEARGGFTFSGGEPLAQPEFLFEVIAGLMPVHIAIETSGFASCHVFGHAMGMADLIIMDAKHMDTNVHKKYTGTGNELILKNMEALLGSEHPCIIRIPVIPGVNDTFENMEETADFLRGSKGLERLELLAYHKTAGAKYPLLRRDYQFSYTGDVKDPEIFRSIFESRGIKVFIP